jgi:hypothetical protein
MVNLEDTLKNFKEFHRNILIKSPKIFIDLSYEINYITKTDEPGKIGRRIQDSKQHIGAPYEGLILNAYEQSKIIASCSVIFDNNLERSLGEGRPYPTNFTFAKIYPAEQEKEHVHPQILLEITEQFWEDVINCAKSIGSHSIYCDPMKDSEYFDLAKELGFRFTGHKIIDKIQYARMDYIVNK